MIKQKAAMTRVFRFKKPDLVNDKVGNDAKIPFYDLKYKPKTSGYSQYSNKNKYVCEPDGYPESPQYQKNAGSN
jgi:hypothetical protein